MPVDRRTKKLLLKLKKYELEAVADSCELEVGDRRKKDSFISAISKNSLSFDEVVEHFDDDRLDELGVSQNLGLFNGDQSQNEDNTLIEDEESDEGYAEDEVESFSEAVVFGTDWTTETIISQITRSNIILNPGFQRRDAWSKKKKSELIESLMLGLPVPQIVLAEKERGKYLVLDGKQRLLSLLQFSGKSEPRSSSAPSDPNNAFRLSGLKVLSELNGQRSDEIQLSESDYFRSFQNQPIRTTIIRNWPHMAYLHTVFLRLNTGSLRLAPQELRQAAFPGPFSERVDAAACNSNSLKKILSIEQPDKRMRDTEILVRYLAFANRVEQYPGRLKEFLDTTCKELNATWGKAKQQVDDQIQSFELGVEALFEIFGTTHIARKPGGKQFNRAIFDPLIFFARDLRVRREMLMRRVEVRRAYKKLFSNSNFVRSVEQLTSGTLQTKNRLHIWGQELAQAIGKRISLPTVGPG